MPQEKKRSVKQPKDKNAPKRNMSAYFLFSNNRRGPLQEQYKDKKITEISKLISVEWKAMDDNAKKPWNDKAAVEKAEYDKKLAAYKDTDEYRAYQAVLTRWKAENKEHSSSKHKHKHKGKKGKKGKLPPKPKKPKDDSAPKRPQTSYFLFTAEIRQQCKEEHPTMKVTELAKVMSDKWKALTAEQKSVYENKAKENKVKYDAEMKEYKQTPEYAAFAEKMKAYDAANRKYNDACKKGKESSSDESSSDSDSSSSSDDSSDSSDSSSSSSSGSTSSGSSSSSGSSR